MNNILSQPKSTLLGVLIAIVIGALGMIHHGHLDLSQSLDTATIIPMFSTLALGAISTDNSALVNLFFDNWRTTLIGIVSATATAVLGTMAAGQLSYKVIGLAAIAGIYGWVSTHKEEPAPPPSDPPTSDS